MCVGLWGRILKCSKVRVMTVTQLCGYVKKKKKHCFEKVYILACEIYHKKAIIK